MGPDISQSIGSFGIWYVVFLFTLTIHEASHSLVAWLGGDETAYRGGQVTLNPLPHMRREPFGTILVPLISFFYSGWMMGWASAPYDPEWGRRHPTRQAIMSAAGPASNLCLGALAFFVIKLFLRAGLFVAPAQVNFSQMVVPAPGLAEGHWAYPVAFALSVALNLNILLCLFNLIPLPPLDGAGVLQGLWPDGAGRMFDAFHRNPMLSLVGLVVAWQAFDYIFPPVFGIMLSLLHPGLVYQ